MAKPKRKRKQTEQAKQTRQTNWAVIGGVALFGVIALFGLLYLNMQPKEQLTLEARCTEEETNCVTFGAADAPITMIEVLDFGCPHCRDFHVETAPLIEESYVNSGQVKFIYYPYALGSHTLPAANASLCAHEQNAYLPFVDALFSEFDIPESRSRDGLLQVASTLEIDMEEFTTCVDGNRYEDTIQENIDVARRQRINSTPSFVINGRTVSGARPFADFQQQIETLLN